MLSTLRTSEWERRCRSSRGRGSPWSPRWGRRNGGLPHRHALPLHKLQPVAAHTADVALLVFVVVPADPARVLPLPLPHLEPSHHPSVTAATATQDIAAGGIARCAWSRKNKQDRGSDERLNPDFFYGVKRRDCWGAWLLSSLLSVQETKWENKVLETGQRRKSRFGDLLVFRQN